MTQFFPQWTVIFTATNRKPFASSILVAHGEQYRNCHFGELMVKIMQ